MKKLPAALLLLVGCLSSFNAACAGETTALDTIWTADQNKLDILCQKPRTPGCILPGRFPGRIPAGPISAVKRPALELPRVKRPSIEISMPREEITIQQKTIWEAPTSFDRLIENDIEKAQIDHGPTSAEAGRLMLAYAKQYLDRKEYAKAAKLADKIIMLNSKTKIDGISIGDVAKLKAEARRKNNLNHPNNSNRLKNSYYVSNKPISPVSPTAINIGPGLRLISY